MTISKLYSVHDIASLTYLKPDTIRKRIARLEIVSVEIALTKNNKFESLLYNQEQFEKIRDYQRKIPEPKHTAEIYVVKSEFVDNIFFAFSDSIERKFTVDSENEIQEKHLFNSVEKLMLQKLGFKI